MCGRCVCICGFECPVGATALRVCVSVLRRRGLSFVIGAAGCPFGGNGDAVGPLVYDNWRSQDTVA